MPSVLSIPTAASAIPYRPIPALAAPPDRKKASRMQTATMMMGMAVDSIPKPRPPMMMVAAPVWLLPLSSCVGLKVSEV